MKADTQPTTSGRGWGLVGQCSGQHKATAMAATIITIIINKTIIAICTRCCCFSSMLSSLLKGTICATLDGFSKNVKREGKMKPPLDQSRTDGYLKVVAI